MILNLVDRRPRVDGPGSRVVDQWGLFQTLAAKLGPPDWSVDLVLVDDSLMTRVNSDYRQAGSVTDVLSFSYLAEAEPGQAELTAGTLGAAMDLQRDTTRSAEESDGDPVVGEVLLAPDFVVTRCEENGWPVELEFPMLVVHGLLHILGWDHQEDQERQAMQDIEEAILADAKLTHPLRQRS